MHENIINLIESNNYEQALSELNNYLTSNPADNNTYILQCTIYLALNDIHAFYEAIGEGLKADFKNYELYVILASYYMNRNLNQAALCLEQALLYCNKDEDIAIIKEQLSSLDDKTSIRDVSIIILSYNTKEITKTCLNHIFASCANDNIEVIVIDNASSDGSVEMLKEYPNITAVYNSENKGFPAGCNQGMSLACSSNDLLLLNSDALLMPNSLFWLRMGLYENDTVGCTGATTNYASNYQAVGKVINSYEEVYNYSINTNIPMESPYIKKMFLIGFALLIRRDAFTKVGYLDESFSPGNYEDTDYGLRMIEAGYQMILCKNCMIYHYGHASFKKVGDKFSSIIDKNVKYFVNKWGFDVNYYCHERSHLTNFITDNGNSPLRILEIGCGCGGTIAYLEYRFPNAQIEGIELSPKAVYFGSKFFNITQGNIENLSVPLKENYYDYIIMGDVLEHLNDPWKVLTDIRNSLKEGGHVIASIHNIMHFSVMKELLGGNFEYKDSGILDRTHMRFFTMKTIISMFLTSGYKIKDFALIADGSEHEDDNVKLIDKLVELSNDIGRNQFETVQYYVLAQKSS